MLIPAVSLGGGAGMGHMDGPLIEHAGVKRLLQTDFWKILDIRSIKIHLKTLKPFYSLVSHLWVNEKCGFSILICKCLLFFPALVHRTPTGFDL